MTAYIIRRLLLVIPTLVGIMTINFVIIQIAPGGPVEQMIAKLQGEAVSATERLSGGGEDVKGQKKAVSEKSSKYKKYIIDKIFYSGNPVSPLEAKSHRFLFFNAKN